MHDRIAVDIKVPNQTRIGVLVLGIVFLQGFFNQRNVLPTVTPGATSFPSNLMIANTSDQTGDMEIFSKRLGSSELQNLSNNAQVDQYASWSPDGKLLAFASVREGNWDIFLVDADGSDLTKLTQSSAQETEPAWSPDGSQLAFASDGAGNYDIYIINSDGTQPTRPY